MKHNSILPDRWRSGTSNCLHTSGVPACRELYSGKGWRNKTAGWRPGEPARGSAPWCSLLVFLYSSKIVSLHLLPPLRFGISLILVYNLAPCLYASPAPLCLLLPCYDDDATWGVTGGVVRTVRLGSTAVVCRGFGDHRGIFALHEF